MDKFIEKVLENTPLAVMVIGLFLFVIGAAGGWPKPELQVNQTGWRLALAGMGVVVFLIGGLFFWRERTRGGEVKQQSNEDWEIKITSHRNGDRVTGRFDVKGSYSLRPSGDYVVKLLEMSPNTHKYWPKREVVFHSDNTWTASSISVGGDPDSERIIIIAALGKGGQALGDYFDDVEEETRQLRRRLKGETIRLPGIPRLTSDVVKCDEIRVHHA
jgi:hypothetical protein